MQWYLYFVLSKTLILIEPKMCMNSFWVIHSKLTFFCQQEIQDGCHHRTLFYKEYIGIVKEKISQNNNQSNQSVIKLQQIHTAFHLKRKVR